MAVTATKERVEMLCRALGCIPEKKDASLHGEIYVAMSPVLFNQPDHDKAHYKAMWFVARDEDHVDYGPVMFFDWNHDDDKGWTSDQKKAARMNKALKEAKAFLKTRERIRDGG